MDPNQNQSQGADPDPDPDALALSRLIQAHATRHAAPANLRAGLRTQAALADASRPPARHQRTDGPRRWTGRWAGPGWRSAAAGFVLGLACMAVVVPLLQHLEQALVAIDFLDPTAPKKLMPRLNQLFNRAALTQEEIHILRGVAKAMLEAANKTKR